MFRINETNALSRIICARWEGESEKANTEAGHNHRLNLTIGALSWKALTDCDLTEDAENRIYDYTSFEWIMDSELNDLQLSACELIFEKIPEVFKNFIMLKINTKEIYKQNDINDKPQKTNQFHRLIFNREHLINSSNYFKNCLEETSNLTIPPGLLYINKPKQDIKITPNILLNFLRNINSPNQLIINSENFCEIYFLSIYYGSREARKECLETKISFNKDLFQKQLDILSNSKGKKETQLDFLYWIVMQDNAGEWINAWENYSQSSSDNIKNINNDFDPKSFTTKCRNLYGYLNVLNFQIDRFGSSSSLMHVTCNLNEQNAKTYIDFFEKFGADIDSINYLNEILNYEEIENILNSIANNVPNLKVLETHHCPLIPLIWLNSIEGLVLYESSIESLLLPKAEYLLVENCFELEEIRAENLLEAILLIDKTSTNEDFPDRESPELKSFIVPQLRVLTTENVNFDPESDKAWMETVETVILKYCNLTELSLKKAEKLTIENCFQLKDIEGGSLLEINFNNEESTNPTTLYRLATPNIEYLSLINLDFSNMENPFIWTNCISLKLCDTKGLSEIQIAETSDINFINIDPNEKIEISGPNGEILFVTEDR